jgi:regulation of enolase protein 1 (concanavalin A-like superfamily)
MRYLTILALTLLTVASAQAENNLPDGWSEAIFGNGGLDTDSSWNYANGTWTITTSGDDIWSIKDLGTFLYLPVTGDVTITAHVASLGNSHEWAKAGVMIRQDNSFGAADAFVGGTISHQTTFTYRPTAAVNTIDCGETGTSVPTWVRLSRTGSSISAFTSSDGANWTEMPGSPKTGIALSDACYVGLAASSHTIHSDTTAVFDNVTVTGAGAGTGGTGTGGTGTGGTGTGGTGTGGTGTGGTGGTDGTGTATSTGTEDPAATGGGCGVGSGFGGGISALAFGFYCLFTGRRMTPRHG